MAAPLKLLEAAKAAACPSCLRISWALGPLPPKDRSTQWRLWEVSPIPTESSLPSGAEHGGALLPKVGEPPHHLWEGPAGPRLGAWAESAIRQTEACGNAFGRATMRLVSALAPNAIAHLSSPRHVTGVEQDSLRYGECPEPLGSKPGGTRE
jgi:hypothetical protein